MTRSRKLGLLLAAASLAVFIASVYVMSRRAADYNRAADHPEYIMIRRVNRDFTVHGREAHIRDAAAESGEAALHITYGDAERTIPVRPPPVQGAPNLQLYDEWVAVLETWRVQRDAESGDAERIPDSARLIIVNRRTPEGFDPETWGQVRRTDWTFDFYELTAGGEIDHRVRRWPRSSHGDAVARRDPHSELAQIEPLEERSFEYLAALHVIPKLAMPKYKFKDTAVYGMGWTLPVAGLSGLLVLVGLFLVLRPAESSKATNRQNSK